MSIRAGAVLPAALTIPEQIKSDRTDYFKALAAEADRQGRVDVTTIEELLGRLLANQLASFYRSAGGR